MLEFWCLETWEFWPWKEYQKNNMESTKVPILIYLQEHLAFSDLGGTFLIEFILCWWLIREDISSPELETINVHKEEKYQRWKWLLFSNYSQNILWSEMIYLSGNKKYHVHVKFYMWNSGVRRICLFSLLFQVSCICTLRKVIKNFIVILNNSYTYWH